MAEGLRIGPDLVPIYLHRGLFELLRGDPLARAGRWRDALARYDEALRYAPAWAQLHQARDAVAAKLAAAPRPV